MAMYTKALPSQMQERPLLCSPGIHRLYDVLTLCNSILASFSMARPLLLRTYSLDYLCERAGVCYRRILVKFRSACSVEISQSPAIFYNSFAHKALLLALSSLAYVLLLPHFSLISSSRLCSSAFFSEDASATMPTKN